ncbi:hypothetical protein [Microbulbifer aggregans]|uniref:hypothetical protein n=1 Tax=Microbulbifer aggregans TaxID=1769779 RepID=UPI000859698C|nr:hypothetical protein [Microbulbifer aggregans]
MYTENFDKKLEEVFGDYQSPEMEAAWESLKLSYPPESAVAGEVVARSEFGVWVDLGFSFPALLEIIVIEGMNPDLYKKDEYCQIGEKIQARISGYVDSRRQIYIMQKEPRSISEKEQRYNR